MFHPKSSSAKDDILRSNCASITLYGREGCVRCPVAYILVLLNRQTDLRLAVCIIAAQVPLGSVPSNDTTVKDPLQVKSDSLLAWVASFDRVTVTSVKCRTQ